MKDVTLFAVTTITTTALCAAMHLTAADAQRLASSRNPVLVDGAQATGLLEVRSDNGIYGVISVTNPTDRTVRGQLNHATFCTPGSSPMSRMLPMPQQKHEGMCSFELKPGGATNIEFCVQAPIVPAVQNPIAVAIKATQNPMLRSTPPQWSLVVSRSTITLPAFGGSLTMPQGSVALPKEGQVVLAHATTPVTSAERLELSKQ
jgi:hypothetical protein